MPTETQKKLLPYEKEFEAARDILLKKKEAKGWDVRVFYFMDPKDTNGGGIQLAKTNWINEDGLGIHFETWVTEKEMKTKKLKFVMHVLHQTYFPGTEIKPAAFLFPFWEDQDMIDHVTAWKGMKLGRSNPIKGEMRFKETTTDLIVEVFSQFLPLGPAVDRALKQALG